MKNEIRILGLDTCSKRAIVGVVNRGGSYLDGVLTFPRLDAPARRLASHITGTKYFPELKAVMLHDPEGLLDMNLIERIIKLPWITLSIGLEHHDSSYEVLHKNGKQLCFKSGLDSLSVHQILAGTWIIGLLPEPLRIAHLLAKSARCDREWLR